MQAEIAIGPRVIQFSIDDKIENLLFILVVALLAILLTTCIAVFALNIPDEASVDYDVELPRQLQPGHEWDLSCLKSKVEDIGIKNGKIHPSCPADGRSLGAPITPASPHDINDAIHLASLAQPTWSLTSFPERRRVLRTLLAYILSHQEDIVKACCLDSGKTKIDACFGEILVTVEKLQWTIKHGEKALAPSRRPTNLLMAYKKNTVVYEPLGVVAACVSWNYPFHNFISPVISALFSGNAIVVKPSEQTCWSSQYFTRLIRGALRACGHDADVVQDVMCLPEVADYLTSHPGLSHITFIGSRDVALKVCNSAAKVLTPVTVELGGKDPAIILDDETTVNNLEEVAAILMRGTFQSAGQNCIGIERVIALPAAHDKLLAIVNPKIQKLRLGSVLLDTTSIDMGSMISPAPFARLTSLIAAAVDAGATLHTGGHVYNHPLYPNGHFFAPTLLSGVTPDMAIAQTELFAPVFVLMRAETVSDAIRIANSTPYALGASVFGHNRRHVQKCVRGVKAGMVAVNDFGAYYACSLPFGGVRGSGYGRFGGEEGLKGLCNVKALCEDAWWARLLGMRTRIPRLLQYPVDGGRGWEMCKGIVGLGYAIDVRGRVGGLWKLASAGIGLGGSGSETAR